MDIERLKQLAGIPITESSNRFQYEITFEDLGAKYGKIDKAFDAYIKKLIKKNGGELIEVKIVKTIPTYRIRFGTEKIINQFIEDVHTDDEQYEGRISDPKIIDLSYDEEEQERLKSDMDNLRRRSYLW